MDQHEKLARAKVRVEEITGFYVHLVVYAVVNGALFYLNATTDPEWWVQWPILGWGIGLVAHGLTVFGRVPNAVRQWHLRKIHQVHGQMR